MTVIDKVRARRDEREQRNKALIAAVIGNFRELGVDLEDDEEDYAIGFTPVISNPAIKAAFDEGRAYMVTYNTLIGDKVQRGSPDVPVLSMDRLRRIDKSAVFIPAGTLPFPPIGAVSPHHQTIMLTSKAVLEVLDPEKDEGWVAPEHRASLGGIFVNGPFHSRSFGLYREAMEARIPVERYRAVKNSLSRLASIAKIMVEVEEDQICRHFGLDEKAIAQAAGWLEAHSEAEAAFVQSRNAFVRADRAYKASVSEFKRFSNFKWQRR